MSWWESNPKRYERELKELREASIEYEQDEDALKRGKLVLHITIEIGGERQRGEILYPDTYPYFRVLVNIHGLDRKRHYNPINGNLCLLGRGSRRWNPSWSAASHITDRLLQWEKASTADVRESDIEDHQAEPEAAYFPSLKGTMVMVDEFCTLPPELANGYVELRYLPNTSVRSMCRNRKLRVVLLRVLDKEKREIARMPEPIYSHFSSIFTKKSNAPWVSLDSPPYYNGIRDFPDFLKTKLPNGFGEIKTLLESNKEFILGLNFPQESDYSGNKKRGWLFFTRALWLDT